jgi:translation initiation factor eIF-2B subunit gamma
MDGAIISERCVLTGTVVGKKVKIGKGCTLTGCEVQDGNVLGDGTDGKKGEKFLVGGLEDEVGGGEGFTDGGDEGPGRDG